MVDPQPVLADQFVLGEAPLQVPDCREECGGICASGGETQRRRTQSQDRQTG